MDNLNRLVWPDTGRVFAVWAMIMLHVTGADWHDLPANTSDWAWLTVWTGLVRWCVPVFFMISGFLFLSGPASGKPFSKILTQNLLRLLTALTFWGAFYTLYFNPPSEPFSMAGLWAGIKSFGIDWYSGKLHYHLWFLYAIAGLYLIIPLLRPLVNEGNKSIRYYLLGAAFYFSFIQHFIYWGLGINSAFQVPELSVWLFYFLLGNELAQVNLTNRMIPVILLLLSVGFGLVIWPTWYYNQPPHQWEEYFIGNKSIGVALSSMGVFLTVRLFISQIPANGKLARFFLFIAPLSFGIYLVHEFFLQMLFHNYIRIKDLGNPLLNAPFIVLLTFVLSAFSVWVLRKIPVFKKYFL